MRLCVPVGRPGDPQVPVREAGKPLPGVIEVSFFLFQKNTSLKWMSPEFGVKPLSLPPTELALTGGNQNSMQCSDSSPSSEAKYKPF